MSVTVRWVTEKRQHAPLVQSKQKYTAEKQFQIDVFPTFRRAMKEGRKRASQIRGGQGGSAAEPRKVLQKESRAQHSEEVKGRAG